MFFCSRTSSSVRHCGLVSLVRRRRCVTLVQPMPSPRCSDWSRAEIASSDWLDSEVSREGERGEKTFAWQSNYRKKEIWNIFIFFNLEKLQAHHLLYFFCDYWLSILVYSCYTALYKTTSQSKKNFYVSNRKMMDRYYGIMDIGVSPSDE